MITVKGQNWDCQSWGVADGGGDDAAGGDASGTGATWWCVFGYGDGVADDLDGRSWQGSRAIRDDEHAVASGGWRCAFNLRN